VTRTLPDRSGRSHSATMVRSAAMPSSASAARPVAGAANCAAGEAAAKAGIVPGSDPGLEWEETELKFDPVLRAMMRAEVTSRGAIGSA